MAEVLAGHVILSGGGWFACSNTECGWQLRNTLSPREFHASAFPVGEFAAHQEAMLTAAGFGPVKAAQAGALRYIADDFSVNLTAMSGPRIRAWIVARAAAVEGGE